MILSDLNQTLINEIENVICEDQKMRNVLNRKDRINSVLSNNRCRIDNSLNNLDDYINGEKDASHPDALIIVVMEYMIANRNSNIY